MNGGCGDYISCACPGGTFSESAAASNTCAQKEQEPSCNMVVQPLLQCEEKNCVSQCSGSSSGSSSGGSGSGGGTTTVSCVSNTGGTTICYEYKNVPASEVSALNGQCMGTTGTGCPTTNLVGCCSQSQSSGIVTEECYYAPQTASSLEGACVMMSGSSWSSSP